jgi:hypothetical protein
MLDTLLDDPFELEGVVCMYNKHCARLVVLTRIIDARSHTCGKKLIFKPLYYISIDLNPTPSGA